MMLLQYLVNAVSLDEVHHGKEFLWDVQRGRGLGRIGAWLQHTLVPRRCLCINDIDTNHHEAMYKARGWWLDADRFHHKTKKMP